MTSSNSSDPFPDDGSQDDDYFPSFDDNELSFLMGVEIDQFDDLMQMEVESNVFDDELNINAADILDQLGEMVTGDGTKQRLVRKHHAGCNISKVSPKSHKQLSDHGFRTKSDFEVHSYNETVFAVLEPYSENGKIISPHIPIGKARTDGIRFKLKVRDVISEAQVLNEDVKSKATGMGYSILLHSAACLLFTADDAVLEPLSGHDVFRNGINIEVTGLNYNDRATNADFILNKYAIMQLIAEHNTETDQFINYSYNEDIGNTDYLRTKAFDQGDSPYTSEVDKLHNYLSKTPSYAKDLIYEQVLSWYCRKDIDDELPTATLPDTTQLDRAISRGSKVYDGLEYLPAPFRVLSGPVTDLDALKSIKVECLNYDMNTHFHTHPADKDPTKELLSKPTYTCESPFKDGTRATEWLFGELLKFNIFQSIYIESELLSKIVGRRGCFYSKYSGAGISWSIVRSNSLTYYASYYRVGEPEYNCGKWYLHDINLDIWKSPTFKVSTTDIAFAKVLPHRISTMIFSTIAYTDKRERNVVINQILRLSATMRWSTWQTSAIAGDFRFLTLCAVSNSGDIKLMIDKAALKINKPLTFPDYMLLVLLKEFSESPERIGGKLTPLTGMPMRFITIEKDISLCYMWHLRKAEHETNCYRKLINGISLEETIRPMILTALSKQNEYFEKLFSVGASQDDFDSMMDKMPNVPYFNVVLFMSFSEKLAKDMIAGKRQKSVNINISKMITDHHCIYVEDPSYINSNVITSPRVADGINKLLKQYDMPIGIHSLFIRMNEGKPIKNIYTIHPKDSKSKDREIPQMTSHMRVAQFISESAMAIFTDESEVDMMQNPEKYSEFTTKFSNVMRSGGLTRSEDKEFFCGWMHVECMSLAVSAMASSLGNTTMVTSAAILRLDKKRYTVAPIGCDPELYGNLKGNLPITIKEGKKFNSSIASLNYIHFMQGVRAMTGALISTTFASGLDLVQKQCAPDIAFSELVTTSDDSTRGVVVIENSTYDESSVSRDYINMGPKMVVHCMMKDSSDKPIYSNKLAEFNNVVIGPNGMLPHQFIHAHLVIQPLIGETLIDDIVSCTSQARSSLAWGDSIDLARAAMDSYRVLLQQRWLLTQAELDLLYQLQLLPSTDEDIILGYHLSNTTLKLKLLRMVDAATMDMIINDEVSALNALRKFRLAKPGKKPNIQLIQNDSISFCVRRTFSKINTSRKMMGRKNVAFVRSSEYSTRMKVKQDFMEAINGDEPDATPEELEILSQFVEPPDVRIIYSIPRRKDMLPTSQGQTARLFKEPNIKAIMGRRLLNINVTNLLDDEDNEVLNYDDIEFTKYLNKLDVIDKYEGFKFKSPGGLPLMRMHNETIFTRPMTFRFLLNNRTSVISGRLFTHNAIAYPNMVPTFWGGYSLNRCKSDEMIPAFGFSIDGDTISIFYKKKFGRIEVVQRDSDESNYYVARHKGNRIYCPIRKDMSCINPHNFNVKFPTSNLIDITGDSIALLNYGNFLNTSARSSRKIMLSIFNALHSDYPTQIHQMKPSYPYFTDSAIEFTRSNVNHITGTKCITKLKLKYDSNTKQYSDFDVTGDAPRRTNHDTSTANAMWE